MHELSDQGVINQREGNHINCNEIGTDWDIVTMISLDVPYDPLSLITEGSAGCEKMNLVFYLISITT